MSLYGYDDLLEQVQGMQTAEHFNVFRQNTLAARIHSSHMGGAIDRQQFWDLNTLFVELLPASRDKGFLLGRMDAKNGRPARSGGKFAADMLDNSQREVYLARRAEADFPAAGVCKSLSFEDHGCDNTGRLIVARRDNGGNVDFICYCRGLPGVPDGKWPMEMKFDYKMDKATFKLADLLNYNRQDAYVFLVFTDDVQVGGNGCREEPPAYELPAGKTFWTVFGPDTVQKLLKLPMQRYGAMGGKESCRVYADDFHKFFTINKWPV